MGEGGFPCFSVGWKTPTPSWLGACPRHRNWRGVLVWIVLCLVLLGISVVKGGAANPGRGSREVEEIEFRPMGPTENVGVINYAIGIPSDERMKRFGRSQAGSSWRWHDLSLFRRLSGPSCVLCGRIRLSSHEDVRNRGPNQSDSRGHIHKRKVDSLAPLDIRLVKLGIFRQWILSLLNLIPHSPVEGWCSSCIRGNDDHLSPSWIISPGYEDSRFRSYIGSVLEFSICPGFIQGLARGSPLAPREIGINAGHTEDQASEHHHQPILSLLRIFSLAVSCCPSVTGIFAILRGLTSTRRRGRRCVPTWVLAGGTSLISFGLSSGMALTSYSRVSLV